MNKSTIFNILCAACLGGGVGFGGGVAVSPSQNDIAQAVRQAQQQAHAQDCELSVADRAYLSGKVRNSRAKEF